MGFMDRIFGRYGSQEAVDAVLEKRGPRDRKADPRPWDNQTSTSIVGESRHQPALAEFCKRKGDDEVRIEGAAADMVCEPENAYDNHAVRIELGGQKVGYLARGSARRYHRRVAKLGGRITVPAFVGCRKGGKIGVRLNIPHEHPVLVPLSKQG